MFSSAGACIFQCNVVKMSIICFINCFIFFSIIIKCFSRCFEIWTKFSRKMYIFFRLLQFISFFVFVSFFVSHNFYACSEASKMELFATIVNSWKLLTISAKNSILDIWMGSECAFDIIPGVHISDVLKGFRPIKCPYIFSFAVSTSSFEQHFC